MLIENIKLSWHFFLQEYSQNHQRLLRWTQAILLVFIVTLSQTSTSIQHYLEQNLNGLLGADAVIVQKQRISDKQLQQLENLTDQIVVTQQIKTILTHDHNWQQASLKAVNEQYPLQGELLSSNTLNADSTLTNGGPNKGEIWLDARLFASLKVSTGDTLYIAKKPFLVTRVLQHEPDRLMEGHNVDMRALIHSKDLTTLNLSEDLITYRYLLAASSEQIESISQWQKSQLPAANSYHKNGKHPLALFWQRTENFLGLASIILFFMAAIAIEQLTQVHSKKDKYFTAICMSLGISKNAGLQISIFKWLLSLLSVIPISLLISAFCHYAVIHFLNDTFSELAWQWQLNSIAIPLMTTSLIFAIFHLPVWFSLYANSIRTLITTDQGVAKTWLSKVASLLVLTIIAYVYSDNGLLTLMMLSAITFTIIFLILTSWIALTLSEKASQPFSGLMPFALFMMKQRLVAKSTQILGVGLCSFLLLFTLMLLKDLGSTMSAYQRQHDGNVFISQASNEQMSFIQNWSEENEITIRQSKPYMHAQLVAINNKTLNEYTQKPSDSLATLSKSIRLHWSEKLPSNNRLVSGAWWQENSDNWQRVSVEQEVMTDLGLNLGDKLSFFINQQQYQFEISASHEFKPGSGSVTFWVQMPPTALKHIQAPHYHMASLEISEDKWSLLTPLWQQYPTLRMVSLKEMTQLFDQTLSMVTKVISGFSMLISLLSAIVIFASVKALEDKERKKNSVILSFGLSKQACFNLNLIEWLVTAIIAASGAIIGTYVAGILIYQSQFSLTYQPSFLWLTATLTLVLLVITTLGLFSSRHNLKTSVRALLAES